MRQITVGFSKSKKSFPIASWAIRLYQNTPFSHVYLREKIRVFKDDLIIHASEGLVQRMSQFQFDKKHEVVVEFTINIEDDLRYYELKDMMHKYSGDNYSVMQNVGIVWVDFCRNLCGKRKENPWQKGWNCSELVMVILQKLFPKEFEGYDPNTVTPKEVYNILLDLEQRNKIKRKV